MGFGLSKLLNLPTEPEPSEFNHPIFLIGLMRSGTTLLYNTLSEHPQLLRTGFELNKIWTSIGGGPCLGFCPERTEKDFDPTYLNNMTAYFSDFKSESRSFMRHVSRKVQSTREGSGGVYYDWSNLYLMNKSPHLSNKIRYLNKMYPKSKFITIVRSPFGQSASMKMHFDALYQSKKLHHYLPEESGACWSVFENYPSEKENFNCYPNHFNVIPQAWLRLNNTIINHLKHVEEDRKIIVSYEDFLSNKSETLSSVFNFLNLREKHKSVEQKILKKERKIYNTKTKGNPLEKWKKHLTDHEKDIIRSMLSEQSDDYSNIVKHVPNSKNYWIFQDK